MAKFTARATSLFATLTALSCGAGGEVVHDDALCAQLTEALCLGNVDCCDDPAQQAADIASCQEDNLWLCETVIGSIAESDGVVYDAHTAGLLVAAVEASARECSAVPELGLDELLGRSLEGPRGLALVLTGTLPEGEGCGGEGTSPSACGAELVCVPEDGDMTGLGGLAGLAGLTGAGHCAAAPEAPGIGEVCSNFGSLGQCAAGLACASCAFFPETAGCPTEPRLAEGRCVPPAALGAPCDFRSCDAGLYCEGWAGGEPGACAPVKAEGELCDGPTQCEGGSCEAGRCGPTPPERSHCAVWRGRIG